MGLLISTEMDSLYKHIRIPIPKNKEELIEEYGKVLFNQSDDNMDLENNSTIREAILSD